MGGALKQGARSGGIRWTRTPGGTAPTQTSRKLRRTHRRRARSRSSLARSFPRTRDLIISLIFAEVIAAREPNNRNEPRTGMIAETARRLEEAVNPARMRCAQMIPPQDAIEHRWNKWRL